MIDAIVNALNATDDWAHNKTIEKGNKHEHG